MPPSWERAKEEADFEVTPRVLGPFTAVIAEYQRKFNKLATRPASRNLAWTPRPQPMTSLLAVISRLEDMNEI